MRDYIVSVTVKVDMLDAELAGRLLAALERLPCGAGSIYENAESHTLTADFIAEATSALGAAARAEDVFVQAWEQVESGRPLVAGIEVAEAPARERAVAPA